MRKLEYIAYKNMPVYDEYDLQNVTRGQTTKLFVSDTTGVRFWYNRTEHLLLKN